MIIERQRNQFASPPGLLRASFLCPVNIVFAAGKHLEGCATGGIGRVELNPPGMVGGHSQTPFA
jgi:hypothetical protein